MRRCGDVWSGTRLHHQHRIPAGLYRRPWIRHYGAKGAILSFTRSLALEVGERDVPVNAVAPGATMTPILADVPDDVLDGIKANIPAGKIADVADIVAYLFWPVTPPGTFAGSASAPMAGMRCSRLLCKQESLLFGPGAARVTHLFAVPSAERSRRSAP